MKKYNWNLLAGVFIPAVLMIFFFHTGCRQKKKDKNIKASCVEIWYEYLKIKFGSMEIALSDWNGKYEFEGEAKMIGPVKVVIIREIAPELKNDYKKIGLAVGKAYIKKVSDEYEYICNVNLSLSDKDLAKQFGVEN